MRLAPDIVVLGDVNLDTVVEENLTVPFANLTENGHTEWRGIKELLGGTGSNFARIARQAGYQTLLLGCTGADPAREAIVQALEQAGIEAALATRPEPTGRAIIVRDMRDIRLLVDNSPNANRSLTVADLAPYKDTILASRLVYVSGFTVRDQAAPRADALRALFQWLLEASPRPLVMFDVVPHRLYELMTFDALRSIVPITDILISEVATMRRFLRVGGPTEPIDESVARATASMLEAHYRRMILRHGPSGCDCELLWNADTGQSAYLRRDHVGAKDKRGFGDRLAVSALREFFGFVPIP